MTAASYLGFVIPMCYLVLVVRGEARSIVFAYILGMTGSLAVYMLSFLIDEKTVSYEVQIVYLFPLLEEAVKISLLFFMIKKAEGAMKNSLVRFALALGIGFAILENGTYLFQAHAVEETMPAVYIAIRGFTASLLHGSTCAFAAYSLQVMKQQGRVYPCLFAGSFFTAAVFHGLYNLLWISGKIAVLALLAPVCLFALLFFPINAFGLSFSSLNFKRKKS